VRLADVRDVTPLRRTRLRKAIASAGLVAATLFAVDVVCITFDLFPPRTGPGDIEMGWRPDTSYGQMQVDRCFDHSTGKVVKYDRNEDGIRTGLSKTHILADTEAARIAVTGDSHTDLCVPNAALHSGVLESELRSSGVPAVTLPYGAGRFSPLQDYLAFRKVLRPYGPTVLIINFYTGNDFYDLLRVDDRPHFVTDGSGYRIAPPTWYSLDDPSARHRSRVFYAARSLTEPLGLRLLYVRFSELSRVAVQQNAGVTQVIGYMTDIYKAREPRVGYPNALTAQMLNQQLFFHYFRASKQESIRRTKALMALVRAENPDIMLVMSPIPSYQLVRQQPVDQVFLDTVRRLPIRYEDGVQEETELYDRLRDLAQEMGWLFVDNLAALKAHRGPERLYNAFDYHLVPEASALIGRAQAAAIGERLKRRRTVATLLRTDWPS
jgi:hypothetical protein